MQNNLGFRPKCMKIAEAEFVPIDLKDGEIVSLIPWVPSDIICPDCDDTFIRISDVHYCPKCIFYTRFVMQSRRTLANARAAYAAHKESLKLQLPYGIECVGVAA